ncbi:MAG TPA: PPOX class F420-dependent oxidoreductase [Acidimicrobiia bacterium]|nr:PPOX class F420-dependent oxidoreductase [Acidimicrobiia bacterium]
MDTSEGIYFVRHNNRAVLATIRRDGSPQQSPVTVGLVDEAIVMSTRETAYKVRNLRRDPRAWLCVVTDGWYGQWVQLACTTEVVSLPDAMDGLVAYYRALSGEHPDWDDYRRAMVEDQRCLVRFTVLAAGPDAAG